MQYRRRKFGNRLPRAAAVILAAGLALTGCAGGASSGASAAQDAPMSYSMLGSYLAGRHAERERDLGSAAQFMSNVLVRDPDNFEVLNRTELLLLADGQFDEAAAIARRIVELSSANPQANVTLAVAEARAGQFATAAKRLDGLPLSGANRVVLPLMRAWLEQAQGKTTAALDALKSLDGIEGFRPLYEYHAALINDVAGRADVAEQHYRRALGTENSASVRLVEATGNFLERQGKADAARELYERYGTTFPDSVLITAAAERLAAHGGAPPAVVPTATAGLAEGLFNIAGALRQESGGQLALIYARLALALVPDKAAGLVLVADILDNAGRYDQSNALLARIPKDSPLSWSARLRIAENFQAMGQTDAAIDQLEAMTAERTDRYDAAIALGQLLRLKQRFADAAKAYDQAIARIPKIEPRHWALFYARGIARERSNQWSLAESDFLRALELQPEQPEVLNYLAYSWVEKGVNYDRALRMLQRAVELRPNSGHIIDSLGWVLFRLGRFDDAVPLLERAVELQPEDPVLLDHLGDSYWRVGRLSEARFQWERALRNKPEADQRAELQRKLERGLAVSTNTPPG